MHFLIFSVLKDYFLSQINFFYSYGVALIAIILLTSVVKRPMKQFVTISPFYLYPDYNYDTCFQFSTFIQYKRVC